MSWQTLWELRDLLAFAVLVSIGYVVGRRIEARHFTELRERERSSLGLPVLTARHVDPSWDVADAALVTGIAVVSIDYLKLVAASLRNFFGGRLATYETLLDRARREAVLRMKDAARARGATVVLNVRLEIASVSGFDAGGYGAARAAEVIAYGTALTIR
ncbi:MAG TPA: heavy metal-binding domain-containing protein [Candidatus Limnocylindria bacterium]|nr:heavy metal-binding domain-containing protein [Candidatus Limnocylindria bacterium]